MKEDIVRVLRIVEYTGPRSWVEKAVANSIHGERSFRHAGIECIIRAGTIGTYPEILQKAQPEEVRDSEELDDGA